MTDQPATPAVVQPDPGARRRRGWPARWVAAAVGAPVAALIAIFAVLPPAQDRAAQSPLVGQPAPAIHGPSVTPYPFTSLAALAGRWVLVNFFATWCVPCRDEQPQLARFAATHHGEVQLVMVAYNDSATDVRGFLADNGGRWPAVEDPGGQVALAYGVGGIPETYLVDPYGIIVAKIVGGSTVASLDRLLSAAKAAKP